MIRLITEYIFRELRNPHAVVKTKNVLVVSLGCDLKLLLFYFFKDVYKLASHTLHVMYANEVEIDRRTVLWVKFAYELITYLVFRPM